VSRRRYARNPADAELLVGLALAGIVVWAGYEAYQGLKQTGAAIGAGFSSIEAAYTAFQNSVINGITSPLTTFENWLGGGSGAPTASGSSTAAPAFQGLGNTYTGDGSSDASSGGGTSF
jgi:hypothetical protein